jgi:hypothetical protein
MNTDRKSQKDFFTLGWLKWTLTKLGLADVKDIEPSMMTKIRIHEIEKRIVDDVRRGTSELMDSIEKDMYWGDTEDERKPKKKS